MVCCCGADLMVYEILIACTSCVLRLGGATGICFTPFNVR